MPPDPYGRGTRRYRAAVASLRAQQIPNCWLCDQPIDYTTRVGPWRFTLDHIVPVSRGGSLLDPRNHAPAHHRCNVRRGNRPPERKLVTSRRW